MQNIVQRTDLSAFGQRRCYFCMWLLFSFYASRWNDRKYLRSACLYAWPQTLLLACDLYEEQSSYSVYIFLEVSDVNSDLLMTFPLTLRSSKPLLGAWCSTNTSVPFFLFYVSLFWHTRKSKSIHIVLRSQYKVCISFKPFHSCSHLIFRLKDFNNIYCYSTVARLGERRKLKLDVTIHV